MQTHFKIYYGSNVFREKEAKNMSLLAIVLAIGFCFASAGCEDNDWQPGRLSCVALYYVNPLGGPTGTLVTVHGDLVWCLKKTE
ncbi:MAG: hypothetical protein HC819_04690 [Cyclobacteriaceae bacterium]|nr:hypothetical protein [Cyclobacteriaceae bacterium]